MGTFDRIAPLARAHRRRRLRAAVAAGVERLRARLDDDRHARRRARGTRRGHLLHARPITTSSPQPGSLGLAGSHTIATRSRSSSTACELFTGEPGMPAVARLPPLGVRERRARPRAAAGRRDARRGRRPRAGAAALRRLDAARRARLARGRARASSSRSIRFRASGTRRTWTPSPRPGGCACATSRRTTSARPSTPCRTRPSTR